MEATDVRATRAGLGVTQSDFALTIGVSRATLRNWEQGRRVSDGPALRIAVTNPEAVVATLNR